MARKPIKSSNRAPAPAPAPRPPARPAAAAPKKPKGGQAAPTLGPAANSGNQRSGGFPANWAQVIQKAIQTPVSMRAERALDEEGYAGESARWVKRNPDMAKALLKAAAGDVAHMMGMQFRKHGRDADDTARAVKAVEITLNALWGGTGGGVGREQDPTDEPTEPEDITTAEVVRPGAVVYDDPDSTTGTEVELGTTFEVVRAFQTSTGTWVEVRLVGSTETQFIRIEDLGNVHIPALDEYANSPESAQMLNATIRIGVPGSDLTYSLGVLTESGIVTHSHWGPSLPANCSTDPACNPEDYVRTPENGLLYLQAATPYVDIEGPDGTIIRVATADLYLAPDINTPNGVMVITFNNYTIIQPDGIEIPINEGYSPEAVGGTAVQIIAPTSSVLSGPETFYQVFNPGESFNPFPRDDLAIAPMQYEGVHQWRGWEGQLLHSTTPSVTNPFNIYPTLASPGDSGGGFFAIVDGQVYLVGVMASGNDFAPIHSTHEVVDITGVENLSLEERQALLDRLGIIEISSEEFGEQP